MFPKGTIYKSGQPTSGETPLQANLVSRIMYQMFRIIGAATVAFVILGIIFTYGPVIQQEVNYYIKKDQISADLDHEYLIAEQAVLAQQIENTKAQAESYGVDSYFSIVIPKLGAASNIIANTSVSNPDEYLNALQKGVAHAKGTHFPGQGENIYLFSHSTDSPLNFARFNAVFYLLNKLEVGDKIIIFFADKKYVYEVTQSQIAQPQDTHYYTADYDSEVLTLQTCYPPGTTLKRLMILAKPI